MFVLQISIQKDEVCTVRDNSNKLRWKVTNSRGQQGEAPGAMFLLTPPDQEAIDTAEKLKRHYDRVITLWQKKHLRMRQNMIFATIKVVKSWDFQQYISMEKEQRIAIRRALNEDSDKLIQVLKFDIILNIAGTLCIEYKYSESTMKVRTTYLN